MSSEEGIAMAARSWALVLFSILSFVTRFVLRRGEGRSTLVEARIHDAGVESKVAG